MLGSGSANRKTGLAAVSTHRGGQGQVKGGTWRLGKHVKARAECGADDSHLTHTVNSNLFQIPWASVSDHRTGLRQPSGPNHKRPLPQLYGDIIRSWLAMLDKQAFLRAGLHEDPRVRVLDNDFPYMAFIHTCRSQISNTKQVSLCQLFSIIFSRKCHSRVPCEMSLEPSQEVWGKRLVSRNK